MAYKGQSIGGNPRPPRWKFGNTPSLGSQFNRCGDVVRFYVGGYWTASYYKVSWSINCPARTAEKKYKTPGKKVVSRITLTAAHCTNMRGDPYNTYSVKVAACNHHNPPAADTCTRWSPEVLLTYSPTPSLMEVAGGGSRPRRRFLRWPEWEQAPVGGAGSCALWGYEDQPDGPATLGMADQPSADRAAGRAASVPLPEVSPTGVRQ